jgi:hypothetical protein
VVKRCQEPILIRVVKRCQEPILIRFLTPFPRPVVSAKINKLLDAFNAGVEERISRDPELLAEAVRNLGKPAAFITSFFDGRLSPLDNIAYLKGFAQGFVSDGLGGSIEGLGEVAKSSILSAVDPSGMLRYALTGEHPWARSFGVLEALFGVASPVAGHTGAFAQALFSPDPNSVDIYLPKFREVGSVAGVAMLTLAEQIGKLTPEDYGRVNGFIAYQVVELFGLSVAAEVVESGKVAILLERLKESKLASKIPGLADAADAALKVLRGEKAVAPSKLVSPTGLEVTLDATGKPVRWEYTVGPKGTRGPGYRNVDVPDGMQRGHAKPVNHGADINPIDDGPANIIAQTGKVNQSNVKRMENWLASNAQGEKVIMERLSDGNIRVRVPSKNIDVTYNPESTTRWPDNWFLNGGTYD